MTVCYSYSSAPSLRFSEEDTLKSDGHWSSGEGIVIRQTTQTQPTASLSGKRQAQSQCCLHRILHKQPTLSCVECNLHDYRQQCCDENCFSRLRQLQLLLQ